METTPPTRDELLAMCDFWIDSLHQHARRMGFLCVVFDIAVLIWLFRLLLDYPERWLILDGFMITYHTYFSRRCFRVWRKCRAERQRWRNVRTTLLQFHNAETWAQREFFAEQFCHAAHLL